MEPASFFTQAEVLIKKLLPSHMPWRIFALVGLNIFLGVIFLTLPLLGVLPLDTVHFWFFFFLAFLAALYRPSWAFLLLIGFLPFETTNLAPISFGFDLRPYQAVAFLLALALLVRLFTKKISLRFFHLDKWDGAAFLILLGAFLAVPGALDTGIAFRMAVILVSFGLVYFLIRCFLRSSKDIRAIEPFFLSSALVVFLFALWQNVRFLMNEESFMVMAGRPNGSFPEADWLGIYAAFVALFLAGRLSEMLLGKRAWRQAWFLYVSRLGLLVLAWVVLLIAVSRSAWLAAAAGLFLGAFWLIWGLWKKRNDWRVTSLVFGTLSATFLAAFLTVLVFGLTSFDLSNRAISTATGDQQITVSCLQPARLPARVETLSELPEGCRHILLEEIESEKNQGHVVSELDRSDPNVDIRAGIYAKIGSVLREHWLWGIGWGNIALLLGSDERGAGLNASNMFLEVWLGSGVFGLLGFLGLWGGIGFFTLWRGLAGMYNFQTLFVLWSVLLIFNLFNAGLLLGFVFFFLAWAVQSLSWRSEP